MIPEADAAPIDGAVRRKENEEKMDLSVEVREHRQGQWTYWRLMARGAAWLGWLLLTHGSEIRRFRQPQPTEERYQRPPRRYDLPPYEEGMAYCRSSRRFLRPTRYCNSRAPEVIAMAHSLGAYRRSDAEFAEAAFAFAKERVVFEIGRIIPVEETLRRGTGSCFDCISAFIALCRCASIPARYKLFTGDMIQSWRNALIEIDPLMTKWYDAISYFMFEGEGEAYVDGRWRVAHVGPTAERQAAGGVPITRFGEDSLGLWFHAKPGTIMRVESIPPGLGVGSRAFFAISPGTVERVNVSVGKQIAEGRRIIEAAGGLQAYDRQARLAGPGQGA
jgi:hypothetical protein